MGFLSMALAIEKTPPALNSPAGPIPVVDSDSKDLAAVLRMRLSAFARSGEWLRIRSRLLGEDIILAADNATGLPPGVPVYRADELRFLIGLDPEGLRGVHRIKSTFAGAVHDRRRINTLGGSKNEGP